MSLRFALIPGEPAGTGPDLCLLFTRSTQHHPLITITSHTLLQECAGQLGLTIDLKNASPATWPERPAKAGQLYVWGMPLAAPVWLGQLDCVNAAYVLETLTRVGQGYLDGHFAGMITAPVHKGVVNEASIPFSGHAEFLVDLIHTAQVVMMLATRGLRVALATTHLPLHEAADAVSDERLSQVARILHADLRNKLGIAHPHVLVCGLNPHAGGGDHLGREEIKVIEPCLERLYDESLDLIGPLPAGILFTPKHLEHYNTVLVMYHDQGPPVLKHKDFGTAVNVTPDLPVIRTFIDHGTAPDLAGSDRIDSGGLQIVLETAYQMAASRY